MTKTTTPPLRTQQARITRRDFLKRAMTTIGAACIALPSYSFFLERYWVETTHLTLTLPQLPPSFSGLRVVQLSDIHLGFYYNINHLEGIIRRVNQLEPDLICFTGDLVDDAIDGLEQSVPLLRKLHAPLGKVAIFGNHDFRSGHPNMVRSTLIKSGFTFLRNSHITLNKYGDPFHIAGLDDLFGGHPDMDRTLSPIPKSEFTMLLAHEPDMADYIGNYNVNFMLSGHSHGGQIRLPFYGAVYRPDGAKHYVRGLKTIPEKGLTLYVNRGIGTTFLPIRFNCRPEITLFTLNAST
jgi:uncharacterized protein